MSRGDGELTVGEQNGLPSFGSIISRIFGDGSQADLTVEAEIPAAAQLHLASVSADTEVSGMRGEQRYSTVSGDIQLRDVGGSVRLDAVSGDANLRTEEPVAVQAQGVSGDVSIMAPLLRSLRANTVSGDVELDAELDARGEFRVESVSGDLAVGLIGSATFEVHGLSTDVHSELDHRLEGQVDRRRLIIGSGGPRLVFNSMSGDVDVRRPRRIVPVAKAARPSPPASSRCCAPWSAARSTWTRRPAASPAEAEMGDELATVLRLVSEGTLSPEEAAPIIEALTRSSAPRPDRDARALDPAGAASGRGATRGRRVRIQVSERGRRVVDVRVPLAFAAMAAKMVPGIPDSYAALIAAGGRDRTRSGRSSTWPRTRTATPS